MLATWKVALVLVVALVVGIFSFGTGTTVSEAAAVSKPGPDYRVPVALAERTVAKEVRSDAQRQGRVIGNGEASFYGAAFAGRPTANGEIFDPGLLTAAHPSLPFGSTVRVTNKANGKTVTVRINDRGPFAKNRIIDLSQEAASRIGMIQSGTATVTLELV
ncbi:MAG: septal ring lytic transglycosylase RlpA family protein [Bacteroidota bacterium]